MSRRVAALALAPLVLFALLHVAGERAHVGMLSGTLPATSTELLLGTAYVLGWFAAVLVAPIFALALLLDGACGRIAAKLD